MTHRPPLLPLGLAGLALALCSCTVGPDYRPVAVEVPTAYKSALPADQERSPLAPDWWKLFKDDKLSELEERAVVYNQDLRAAAARVVQARAARGVVASQFYPVITLDPSLTRSRSSANVSTSGNSRAITATHVSIPFDLSYEVDIWGRVRRSVESADAQVAASLSDMGVVLQTLTGDVAQNYFTLRGLDAQSVILNRNIDLYRNQIQLSKTQYKAGLVGQTDVIQTQTLLDSAIAQETDTRRQRADVEHALAILVGRPPSALSIDPTPLDGTPPIVPAGLPGDVLRQRPDVAEAENNLIAANADVGVAIANFYPTLRLTGAAGFESIGTSHALDWESRIWSIGPSLSVPIFEGGKLSSQLEQAKARYDELVAAYRSTVLTAFREVEDSLSDLHFRADQADSLAKAVASSQEYLRLAQLQYKQGLVGYLQVLDADRTLLDNELTAVQTLTQRYISSVLLIKALGGGWSPELAAQDPQTQRATGPVKTSQASGGSDKGTPSSR